MTTKLRILLADDHATVREGLCMILNAQPDMEVVGTASEGHAALQEAERVKPDVVIMDISMPGLNGLEATAQLMKRSPSARVLTLTRHTDLSYLRQLMSAGAAGYVMKQSPAETLLSAVRTVAGGRNYVDEAMAPANAEAADRSIDIREPSRPLSKREMEVMRLIAWGATNKEIAQKLQLSVKTIEAHKANGMRKLGMGSRVDIVRYAVLHDWLAQS
ncbi:MAG: response regulator transcription factor [Cyanobacteria bacterium]|nr:response regulator transcription factor [Cyanobacteriota bacterium]